MFLKVKFLEFLEPTKAPLGNGLYFLIASTHIPCHSRSNADKELILLGSYNMTFFDWWDLKHILTWDLISWVRQLKTDGPSPSILWPYAMKVFIGDNQHLELQLVTSAVHIPKVYTRKHCPQWGISNWGEICESLPVFTSSWTDQALKTQNY